MRDAEKRKRTTVHITRLLLQNMLDDPVAMIMVLDDEYRGPQDLEDKISEILEYLEKTNPEEASA